MKESWATTKIAVSITRGIQSLAVIFQIFMGLFGGIVSSCLLLILLMNEYTRIFAALYIGWAFILNFRTPYQGGCSPAFQIVRRWKMWRYFCDYFPIQLVKTTDLDPEDNYIFCYHPHGIVCLGAQGNFCGEATGFSDKFPGIYPHLLTLSLNFNLPLIREYSLSMGVCSVEKSSIEYILRKMGPGHSVVIVVGGASEALEARPGSFKLTLKERKGFIKLALINGASLVPVFSFGENDLFDQVSNPTGSALRQWQTKMKAYTGVAPVLFYGRALGLLPHRRPIHTVFGAPIKVSRVENPSKEEVDKLHSQYVKSLQELFDKHKTNYGIAEDVHLEIH